MSVHITNPLKIEFSPEAKNLLDTERDDYIRYARSRYAQEETDIYIKNTLRLKDVIGEMIPESFKTVSVEDEDAWSGLNMKNDYRTAVLIDVFYYLRCLSIEKSERSRMGFSESTLIHELHYTIVDMLELV